MSRLRLADKWLFGTVSSASLLFAKLVRRELWLGFSVEQRV